MKKAVSLLPIVSLWGIFSLCSFIVLFLLFGGDIYWLTWVNTFVFYIWGGFGCVVYIAIHCKIRKSLKRKLLYIFCIYLFLYIMVFRSFAVHRVAKVGDEISHHSIAGIGYKSERFGTWADLSNGYLLFFLPGILVELSIRHAVEPIGSDFNY